MMTRESRRTFELDCIAEAILDDYFTELILWSHVFPLAASFSNIVNTVEAKENSREGRRLACF